MVLRIRSQIALRPCTPLHWLSLLNGGRRRSAISTECMSETGTLALNAGSPRYEAIDAVSTRAREDKPNEDQRVQDLGEV